MFVQIVNRLVFLIYKKKNFFDMNVVAKVVIALIAGLFFFFLIISGVALVVAFFWPVGIFSMHFDAVFVFLFIDVCSHLFGSNT